MADCFEIDFLGVETAKSGDAITLRYSVNGTEGVHVVEGGYLDTGDQIVEHLKTRLHESLLSDGTGNRNVCATAKRNDDTTGDAATLLGHQVCRIRRSRQSRLSVQL